MSALLSSLLKSHPLSSTSSLPVITSSLSSLSVDDLSISEYRSNEVSPPRTHIYLSSYGCLLLIRKNKPYLHTPSKSSLFIWHYMAFLLQRHSFGNAPLSHMINFSLHIGFIIKQYSVISPISLLWLISWNLLSYFSLSLCRKTPWRSFLSICL